MQQAVHVVPLGPEDQNISEHNTPAVNGPTGQAVALTAILEDERDGDGDTAAQLESTEQVETDVEERRQIGGGLLKQVTVKSGYLLKKGERRKTWKKRYFVLRPDRLCYYKDDREYQILQHIAVSEVHACAQVEVKKHENSFGIVTPQRTFYVKADSAEQADDWVKQINRARKDIERQKQDDPIAASVTASNSDAHQDGRSQLDASSQTTSFAAGGSRPIAIRQSVSGSPLRHSDVRMGNSYTDASLFSTSESSNTVDQFLSSSYASNSSGQSGPRGPSFLQDRFTIETGRHSETEDMYDESSTLHRNPTTHYLTSPVERGRGAFSSSEEDDEADERRANTSLPASGSLKAQLNPERVVYSGYLMKQGKRKNWRKRWFVLTSDKLLYARSHMDNKAHRCINLDTVLDAIEVAPKIASTDAGESTLPTFNTKKSPQNTFKIITPKRTYVVCAPSEEDEIKWISSIRVLLSAHRESPSATEAPTPTHVGSSNNPEAVSVPPSIPLGSTTILKTPPSPSSAQYCSIESQLERATANMQRLST